MLTRRTLVLGGLGAMAACSRKKAKGFSGYAFIANQEGGAVAAVDLEVFAVARHIRLDGAPTDVVARPLRARVYALTPANGTVHEIDSSNLSFARKVRVSQAAITMRLSPTTPTLYVLSSEPRQLAAVTLNTLSVEWTVPLPADAVDFDVSRDGSLLAVSHGTSQSITVIDAARHQAFAAIQTGGEVGAVRFRSDSRQLIAANLGERMLSFYQTEDRRLIVNLPLAVRPDQLCFKADGGELFVTGEGMDAVVVVEPYYTPQVAQTVLAGHNPGAMAASNSNSPGYLFVANPQAGDISILDVTTKEVVGVTPVGTKPSYITITPDDQYALVLNESSGDMAVIRIPNVTRAVAQQKRWEKKGPLFMLIPVGSKPVSAAIVGI